MGRGGCRRGEIVVGGRRASEKTQAGDGAGGAGRVLEGQLQGSLC